MRVETKISPPNSIVLIMDAVTGQPPETFGGALIATTATCIAVGTLSEQEGETTVLLSDESTYEDPTCQILAYEGSLTVLGGEVSVMTALNNVILKLPVQARDVWVRVWVNDKSEPDRVVVIVGVAR